VRVDGDRLWERLQRLARVGAVTAAEGGGIVRPAYGTAHVEAAGLVAGWMRDAGLEVASDATGNLMGTWPGREPDLPAIALGSHLDSVPNGGAFDGALGVLGALEAVQSLRERGERPRRSVVVLAFADEEGNNFGIGVLSAQLWIGEIPPERYATIQDREGRSLDAYLDAFTVPGVARAERPALAAYLEAHVEQGPVLDTSGRPAAAVEGIVGLSRTTVAFTGQANHAGTTPMTLRHDALWGGAELALAVRDLALAADGRAVATVGVFEVGPGATNVIPGAVRLRVELRSPDEDRLAHLRDEVERIARERADRHGLEVAIDGWHHAPAVPMDPLVLRTTQDALEDAGLPRFTMPSWAGHDAKVLARALPVGMVFVPSVGGVSHAPNEETAPADCATAAELLYFAIRRLDRALDEPGAEPPRPTQEEDPR
jgi:hydantoinase/carbamoylase family amidase